MIHNILKDHGLGGRGKVLKSHQTVWTTVTSGTSTTVTISAVDTSKSAILVYVDDDGGTAYFRNCKFVASFTNSTTISLERYLDDGVNVSVMVEVYEFYNVKSIQTGTASATSTSDLDITVSSVNVDKSLVLVGSEKLDGTSSGWDLVYYQPYLSSATNIKIKNPSGTAGSPAYYGWAIIEFW